MPKTLLKNGVFSGAFAKSSVPTRLLTGAGAKAEATAKVAARTAAVFMVDWFLFATNEADLLRRFPRLCVYVDNSAT